MSRKEILTAFNYLVYKVALNSEHVKKHDLQVVFNNAYTAGWNERQQAKEDQQSVKYGEEFGYGEPFDTKSTRSLTEVAFYYAPNGMLKTENHN